MIIQPGSILISSPLLEDPHFEKAVIVITEYNEKGAMGFVVNKLFPRRLNELVEFKNSRPIAFYAGGPVETENIYFLHRRQELIDAGTHLFGAVFLGGDFKQALLHIDAGSINSSSIKLLIGYCGWDAMELEAEIAEGSWLLTEAEEEIIFDNAIEMLWESLYKRTDHSW